MLKKNRLDSGQIELLLNKAQTATLTTVNADGSPYAVPMHFVYFNHEIYMHCALKGQKTDNILSNPKVSVTVYEMESLLLDPDNRPCNTNTKYQSVIITGEAEFVEDFELKKAALNEVVSKYTPHLSGAELPENRVKGTAVIKVNVSALTGKYYG